MEFSEILAATARDGGVELTPDWQQGRTAYGGLSAALCLAAALRAHPDLPPLRSAQFAFVGPAAGRLTTDLQVLRQGKSSAFVGVDLTGEAGLACRAILCFGAARPSNHDHVDLPFPAETSGPDACPPFFNVPTPPAFSHHFDAALAAGQRPGSATKDPLVRVWLRHRDPQRTDSAVALLALADAIPPAAMLLSKEFAPISTMTWSLDILTEQPVSDDGWWLLESRAETAQVGYSAQAMTVWGAGGQPVIAARQTVAIFN